MRMPRILPVLLAAVMLGCWLTCAVETDAAHSETEQSCVTCCTSHRAVNTPAAVVPHEFTALPGGHLASVSALQSQTVIRLLDPPPKSSR